MNCRSKAHITRCERYTLLPSYLKFGDFNKGENKDNALYLYFVRIVLRCYFTIGKLFYSFVFFVVLFNIRLSWACSSALLGR